MTKRTSAGWFPRPAQFCDDAGTVSLVRGKAGAATTNPAAAQAVSSRVNFDG